MTPSISSLAWAQFCCVFQHKGAQGWRWQGAWVPAACPRVMASSATRLGSPAGSPGWRRGAQMCPPQGIAGREILREGPELTLFLFWTQKQIQGIVEVRNSTNNRHWKKKKKSWAFMCRIEQQEDMLSFWKGWHLSYWSDLYNVTAACWHYRILVD